MSWWSVVDDLEVRAARPEDLGDLDRRFGQGYLFAERLSRQADERGLLLLGLLAGEIVGCVYLWLEPAEEPEIRELDHAALISHLRIQDAHQGRRFGRELLDVAETVLCELWYSTAVLGVDPEDETLIGWYEELGYRLYSDKPIKTTHQLFLRRGLRIALPDECVLLVKALTP